MVSLKRRRVQEEFLFWLAVHTMIRFWMSFITRLIPNLTNATRSCLGTTMEGERKSFGYIAVWKISFWKRRQHGFRISSMHQIDFSKA